MHPAVPAPDYASLGAALVRENCLCSAPELHGVLVGLLAGGARLNKQRLFKVLEAHLELSGALPDSLGEMSWQLHQQTLADLTDSDLPFQPLLPDDDEEALVQRAMLLGEFCDGFLVGFGTAARKGDEERLSEEARDALAQLVEISHIDTDEELNEQEDESAYIELHEFVRLAVTILFTELAPSEEHQSLSDGSLH